MWLLAILLLPVLWIALRRVGKFGITRVDAAPVSYGSRFLLVLPRVLLALSFVALCLALARPQRVYFEADQSTQSRDIIIAVDRSGSMGAPMPGEMPTSIVGETDLDREYPGKTADKDPTKQADAAVRLTRLRMAQAATLDFIRNRFKVNEGDRIGMLLFDYSPYFSWPLTSDLKMIYRKIRFAEDLGGGTNFGSVDPGPIDAAVDHFNEFGQAKSKVIILVTDGEDNISASAMERLEGKINSNNIRLYVIGVGPSLAQYDVDIIRLADKVNGKAFRVEQAGDLQLVFSAIDQMERSSVAVHSSEKRDERFAAFAMAAILLLLMAGFAEAIILNQ